MESLQVLCMATIIKSLCPIEINQHFENFAINISIRSYKLCRKMQCFKELDFMTSKINYFSRMDNNISLTNENEYICEYIGPNTKKDIIDSLYCNIEYNDGIYDFRDFNVLIGAVIISNRNDVDYCNCKRRIEKFFYWYPKKQYDNYKQYSNIINNINKDVEEICTSCAKNIKYNNYISNKNYKYCCDCIGIKPYTIKCYNCGLQNIVGYDTSSISNFLI